MSLDALSFPLPADAAFASADGADLIGAPTEPEFDAIVQLAHRLLGCPIALVSLVDAERLWFKARHGIDGDSMPRDQSFCTHTVARDDVLVVEDARLDPVFASMSAVTGPPHVRFYAGAPLRQADPSRPDHRVAIGALCVSDTEPRRLGEAERATLVMLAGLVDSLIRSRLLTAAAVRSAEQARQAAAMIDRKNRQLGQAERMASIGSWRFDLGSGALEWSDEVFAIHGLPVGDPPHVEDALLFYPEDDRARIAGLLDRAAAHGECYDFESDLTTVAGTVRRVRAIGEVELHDGAAIALIGVFQDITDRYRHETKLREVANTDSLTGLPNRRMFEERLAVLTARAEREQSPLAVLLIDLDGFKPVNDTLGHAAGDRVLRLMAERLRGQSFAHGFVARLGGDEFVMIVSRPRDCAELRGFVQTVLRELRCIAEEDGTRLPVTASVGAALCEGADRAGNLLRDADLALYAAKRSQRGTGRLFGDETAIHPWGKSAPDLRAVG